MTVLTTALCSCEPLFPFSACQHKLVVDGVSKEDGRARVESFALQVFAAADNEDRNGSATQQTAHQFYAAYVFMDVCRQWGELASDLEQKIKYAMWKAADINRAIKEGRQPKPGGVDEEDGFGLGDGRDGMGGGGEFEGSGGGVKAEGVQVEDVNSDVGGGRGGGGGEGMAGGFVAGGSAVGDEDELSSQSFSRYFIKQEPMEEKKAPLEQTHYPPPSTSSSSSSSLPTSYLPSTNPASSYPDTPPPIPPQPPLSPNTANSLGFAPTNQPFQSALSPGYSPGFLGPAIPPHASPSSSPPPPPASSSSRPNLPAPPARRPGSVGPNPASEYTSSSRYSPALPSQITPSALPAVVGKSRSAAVKEAERLMKHAGSALSFDDLDTAIVKMQQAVALLYNHRTIQ